MIETKRLLLREFVMEDAEDMYKLDTNDDVHKYLGEGWMNESIKDAEEAVASIILQYRERGIGRWAAIEKSSGKFIGWSGLKLNTEHPLNGFDVYYDIGYRLLPGFWGKGYATESSIAALDYGFNVLNLETIYGITHIENEASHRVLPKTGLNFIEEFEDDSVNFRLRWYQLNNDDYKKKMP